MIGKFLNDYIENKIFSIDPFVSIDEGVGFNQNSCNSR